MKAYVDKNVCIGCGLCPTIATNVFKLDEDGLAINMNIDEVPLEDEEQVLEAQSSCPVSAIVVE